MPEFPVIDPELHHIARYIFQLCQIATQYHPLEPRRYVFHGDNRCRVYHFTENNFHRIAEPFGNFRHNKVQG